MAVALDSNVVVAFLDRSDAFHRAADSAIRSLLQAGEPIHVSVIAYAEVVTGSRIGHHDQSIVGGFFEDLVLEITPVDVGIADRAADLRSRRSSLRMPDALILATADLNDEVVRFVSTDKIAARTSRLLSCEVSALEPSA